MNRLIIFIFIPLVFFFSCSDEKQHPAVNPVGTWHSHTPWKNNDITITVRPDSMMLFKAMRSFCPGIKYFVGVGKWRIEKDSFLVMERYTDGRHYQVKELFPELYAPGIDTTSIIAIDMNAKYIIARDHLYDIELNGKPSRERYYDRKK